MTVYDWITAHPDAHMRIVRYEPAPDIEDEYGDLVCGGEGTSTVMFDSTTGEGDLAPDLMLKDIINDWEETGLDDDGAYTFEYIPDEYWYSPDGWY